MLSCSRRPSGQDGHSGPEGAEFAGPPASFQENYALGQQLAKGEDSVVYKCTSYADGGTYAVKVCGFQTFYFLHSCNSCL